MKLIGFSLIFLFSFNLFSQETTVVEEEFVPITIEDKEAFMSTKTGEFIFREHAKTDVTALKTTDNGVVYKEIKTHTVKKGETLSIISRMYGLSISTLKGQNKLSKTNLNVGQKLKVIKKIPVKSSSPVIGTSGEETIVARLRPGQTPASLNAPSVNLSKEKNIKASVKKTIVTPAKVVAEKKDVSGLKKEDIVKKAIVTSKEKVVKNSDKIPNQSSYKVKKGDTLYSIAKHFGISVLDLKKINGLALNTISIGQELKINQK